LNVGVIPSKSAADASPILLHESRKHKTLADMGLQGQKAVGRLGRRCSLQAEHDRHQHQGDRVPVQEETDRSWIKGWRHHPRGRQGSKVVTRSTGQRTSSSHGLRACSLPGVEVDETVVVTSTVRCRAGTKVPQKTRRDSAAGVDRGSSLGPSTRASGTEVDRR